jgi:hypothetical protein
MAVHIKQARTFDSRRVEYFEFGKAKVIDKNSLCQGSNNSRGGENEMSFDCFIETIVEDPVNFEKTMNAALLRPVNYEYDSRGNLEMFGISDMGFSESATRDIGSRSR